jgi:hypothetical protein
MLRRIGIALSWLALIVYLISLFSQRRPFEARVLIYPLACIAALATYHLRRNVPVIWSAFGLNVLALASGLIVATGVARYTLHDVGSLVPVLMVTVMFVLPPALNLVNLYRANM